MSGWVLAATLMALGCAGLGGTPGTQADGGPGTNAGGGTASGSSGSVASAASYCGNGRLDPGEACDDGANTGACGTCDSACHVVPLCSCPDPTPDARTYCMDGKLYQYDSCMRRQQLASTCQTYGCMGNACLFYGTRIFASPYPGASAVAVVGGVVYSAGTAIDSFNYGHPMTVQQDAFYGTLKRNFPREQVVGDAPGLAADANGDFFMAGQARGPTGSDLIGAFATKFGPDGEAIWTTALNWGAGEDAAAAAALDARGNLYVAGSAPGFVVSKLDPAGTVLWTQKLADAADATALAVDGSGVYVVGNQSDGNRSFARVAKYGADGSLLWSRSVGPSETLAFGVATDGNGGVYVTGETDGAFDGFLHVGDFDIFLAKMDAEGNDLWARQIGSEDGDVGRGVAVTPAGDVVITGQAGGDLGGGYGSILVREYDASGQPRWTYQIEGPGLGEAVTTDIYGNIFVVGFTSGDLGGESANGGAGFLLKLKPNGLVY